MRSSALLVALASLSSAHFLVNSPPSAGFDDGKEATAPCGGFTPDLSKAADFHVGGDAISLRLTHTQANWLFRVTDDATGQSGWEQIHPIVKQVGLGDFCEPQISVPDKYVGKKGVIGVVCDGPDGLLYQCIAANFVEGTNSSPPSSCKNASITVTEASDSALSALVGDKATKTNATSTGSTSAPSASMTHNAASSLHGTSLSLLGLALIGGAFAM